MQLYMIRHGQSFVNLKEWENGNTDAGLTEKGQQQAAALAAWMPKNVPRVNAIYASTMQRARETAAPLAQIYGIPIQFDDRLREIGNNRFDHAPWPSDDLPEYGEYWGSERPFTSITPARKGGESLMHFRVRLGQFIEEIIAQHKGEIVVAICHGGVIELTFDHVFNIGPWRRCEAWTKNTGITRFEYVEIPKREVWRLYYHSRVEHLVKLEKAVAGGS